MAIRMTWVGLPARGKQELVESGEADLSFPLHTRGPQHGCTCGRGRFPCVLEQRSLPDAGLPDEQESGLWMIRNAGKSAQVPDVLAASQENLGVGRAVPSYPHGLRAGVTPVATTASDPSARRTGASVPRESVPHPKARRKARADERERPSRLTHGRAHGRAAPGIPLR